MFEEELEEMSRKIEKMIKEEFATRSVSVDFENLFGPLDQISQRVTHLQEVIEKTLSLLSKEASQALEEIMKDFNELDGVKRQIMEESMANLKGLTEVKKKVLRSLKDDKNAIKQSIKRYKWVDL